MEKKMWGQYVVMIAVALLLVGGVVVAAEGLLFRDCNNCTVNVPPSNVVQQQVQEVQLGSVAQSNEYHATTTYQNMGLSEPVGVINLASTTGDIYAVKRGSLGSLVVPLLAATSFDIYDATTTNILQRDPSMTTNSIRLASFPASVAAGTYTFDEVYYNGLLVQFNGTNFPSTTITYR